MRTLDHPACQAASDFLADHWRDGQHADTLPPGLRPYSRAEGYAIQALLEGQGLGHRRGWKIAATSAAGQAHINVDGPLAGRLLASRMVAEGEPVPLGANRMRVAEIEFVFSMGRALPPRPKPYSTDDVVAAVAALHLGIEVPDARFTDFTAVGAAQLIADNACADRFVLGPAVVAPWRTLDLAAHTVLGVNGRGFVHEGRGGNVLGDPRIALAWLVNELGQYGITLGEGEVVTTGTASCRCPWCPAMSLLATSAFLAACKSGSRTRAGKTTKDAEDAGSAASRDHLTRHPRRVAASCTPGLNT